MSKNSANNLYKNDTWPFMCAITCIFLYQLGLIVPSLYFGFRDENDTCQEGTRGGLTMSDWLKGFGFEKLFLNILAYISIYLVNRVHEDAIYVPVVVLVLDLFFNIVWSIWGIVLAATTQNRYCIGDGTPIGVMTLIVLLLGLYPHHIKVLRMHLDQSS